MGACVLITGVTGFLGKVVLSELMRRRQELDIDRCVLLIRGRKRLTARQRFDTAVAPSPCFFGLPLGWTRLMDVVEGDLSRELCGLTPLVWRRIRGQVTHVIHCAASVDFDRPVAEACLANITSSLNMLSQAKEMTALKAFVSTSTAYVTPHKVGAIAQVLAPLPRPAQALLADIHGGADETALLNETGHANTYTYTKCLAEHLLVQQRDHVPLVIVRPSIIAASFAHPQPGWIDSKAAFAGFVVTIGSGLLKVVHADPKAYLDIVPVDHVAQVLIDEAFNSANACLKPGQPTPIVHAVAGRAHAAHIGTTSAAIVSYFRKHRVARRPALNHLGDRSKVFAVREALYHRLPLAAALAVSRLRGDGKGARRVRRIAQTLKTINQVFPYFTTQTFAFETHRPLPQGFDIQKYVQIVCQGAHTHLMRPDRGKKLIAGRSHRRTFTAAVRALAPAGSNLSTRLAAAAAHSLFARLFEAVTFDEPAFKRALKAVPEGCQLVLVPTHRSYLDYLLLPYLFNVRPDLGVVAPRIAAAADFVRRPILGHVLQSLRAVGVPRALQPDGLDNAAITGPIAEGHPLMVFLEGERSRDRKVLPLRKDVLAALQRSGRPVALVPVGISYERIAEEAPFLRELQDARRRPLGARALVGWLRRAQQGRVQLGHVHLSAQPPVMLGSGSDLERIDEALRHSLRRSTECTDFHLAAFVRRHPKAGIDVTTLREAIRARGGQVLRSGLSDARSIGLDAALEASMREHWHHLFAWDMMAQYPQCRALAQHLRRAQPNAQPQGMADAHFDEPHLHGLIETLAQPISDDYLAVADLLAAAAPLTGPARLLANKQILAQVPLHDPLMLHEILDVAESYGLVRREQADGEAHLLLLPGCSALWASFRRACALARGDDAQAQLPSVVKRAAPEAHP